MHVYKKYTYRTKTLRGSEYKFNKSLTIQFLSTPLSLKSVMISAGLDMNRFSLNSTQSAATSAAAKAKGFCVYKDGRETTTSENFIKNPSKCVMNSVILYSIVFVLTSFMYQVLCM